MKITIEFDDWDEMEQFRISGRKPRTKKDDVVEEIVTEPISTVTVTPAPTPPPPQNFTPPAVHGFPGGNGGAPTVHPLVTAILTRIDSALSSSGQSADQIVQWFRQQIGPGAENATLEQIRQVFIPRMTEVQLKQLAPQLGIREA